MVTHRAGEQGRAREPDTKATLHIEHAISDFATWKAAFDRFADMRADHGVLHHTVRQPVDNHRYVVTDLAFEHADQASAFLAVLQERVWSTPANSPARVDSPRAHVLVSPQGA